MRTLEDFVVAVYCLVDDALHAQPHGRQLRRRGFAPALSDSDVVTMLVVGEFLGHDTDTGIWAYFGRHWRAWFPGLGSRSQFARQAANLWAVVQQAHAWVARRLGAWDDPVHLIDGVPLPVCRIARMPVCTRLRGDAALSRCASQKAWYFGLKGHLLVTLTGVITALAVTPATTPEREAAWDVVDGVTGLLLGDKGYVGAWFAAALAAGGLRLATPVPANRRRLQPVAVDALVVRVRRTIETVLAQLTGRFHLARVRARDRWHATGRFARKLLAHTIAVALNREDGRPPLQFDGLVAAA